MLIQESSTTERTFSPLDKQGVLWLNLSKDVLNQVPFRILLLGEGNLTFAHALVKKISKSKVFRRYRANREDDVEKKPLKEGNVKNKHYVDASEEDITSNRKLNVKTTPRPSYPPSFLALSPAIITKEMYAYIQVTTFDPISELLTKYPETKPLLEYFSTKTRQRIEVLGNVNATCLAETFLGTTYPSQTRSLNGSTTKGDSNYSTSSSERQVAPPCITSEPLNVLNGNEKEDSNKHSTQQKDEIPSSNTNCCPYLIVFNNPHIGIEDFIRHHSLLSHFFASSRSLINLCRCTTPNSQTIISLDASGQLEQDNIYLHSLLTHSNSLSYVPYSKFLFLSEVVVALCDDQPKRWNLFGAAKRAGFVCVVAVPLVASEYPSYSNKRHQSDCGFPFMEMLQYYFLRERDESITLGKWSVGTKETIVIQQQNYDDLINEFKLTPRNMIHSWDTFWGANSTARDKDCTSPGYTEVSTSNFNENFTGSALSKSSENLGAKKIKQKNYLSGNDEAVDVSHFSLSSVLSCANSTEQECGKVDGVALSATFLQGHSQAGSSMENLSHEKSFFPPFPVLHPSLAFYSSFCTVDGNCDETRTNTSPETGNDVVCSGFTDSATAALSSFISLLKTEKREENFSPYIPPCHLIQLLRLQLEIEKNHLEKKAFATESCPSEKLGIKSRPSGKNNEKKCKGEIGVFANGKCSSHQRETSFSSTASFELAPSPPPHLNPVCLGRPLTELEKKKLRRFQQLYSKKKVKTRYVANPTRDSVSAFPDSRSIDAQTVDFITHGNENLPSSICSEVVSGLKMNTKEVHKLNTMNLDTPKKEAAVPKALDFPCGTSDMPNTPRTSEILTDIQKCSVSAKKNDDNDKVLCVICGISFRDKCEYELHLQNLSPALPASLMERFTCSCCSQPQRFLDERALRQHEARKSKEKVLADSIEQKVLICQF